MSTKRKTTTNKYQRYTTVQLGSYARKLMTKYASLAKTPAWKTTAGKTPVQQRTWIVGQLKASTKVLRSKTLANIDDKLTTLKAQIANRLCLPVSSSKVTSSAIKRLIAKRRQISKVTSIPILVKACTGIKFSSFKNPKASSTRRTTTARRTTSKAKRTKKTKQSRTTTSASVTRKVAAKYKKQTNTLKREIQKLKARNSFMKSQVAKFRKEVTQLQRHYGTLNNVKPRGQVVNLRKVNQDVSNIVRFSNALSNAIQRQRKAG